MPRFRTDDVDGIGGGRRDGEIGEGVLDRSDAGSQGALFAGVGVPVVVGIVDAADDVDVLGPADR